MAKPKKRRKPALPRAPLPKQRSQPCGTINQGQRKRLLAIISERLNDKEV
jgi:hypothetical protein